MSEDAPKLTAKALDSTTRPPLAFNDSESSLTFLTIGATTLIWPAPVNCVNVIIPVVPVDGAKVIAVPVGDVFVVHTQPVSL